MSESLSGTSIKNSGVRPTANLAYIANMPAAGKSGTSTDSSGKARDIWFIGYTPYYTMGVWSGFDEGSVSLQGNVEMNGYHFVIWNKVMSKLHQNYRYTPFLAPEGVSPVRVCSLSGELAVIGVCDKDPQCKPYYEYFAEGTEPTTYCHVHDMVTICTETGLIANEFCPHTEKKLVYHLERNSVTDTLDTPYLADPDLGVCEVHRPPETTEETTEEWEEEEPSFVWDDVE